MSRDDALSTDEGDSLYEAPVYSPLSETQSHIGGSFTESHCSEVEELLSEDDDYV